MKMKKSVDPRGVKVEILLALMVANGVFEAIHHELVVTSICDSVHGEKSLHYAGQAVDLRTKKAGIDQVSAQQLAKIIEYSLPNDYDVVCEADHIHVEWQPKRTQ